MSNSGDAIERSVLENQLDGTNYKKWKFHITAVMRGKGLETVVNGKSQQPEDSADAKEKEAWLQRDGKATAILFASINDEQKNHVLSCTTAKEIMDKIDTIHQKKSDVRIMTLYEDYFSIRMKEDESVAAYVSKVTTLAAEIEDQGEKLSDNIKMCRIVRGLTGKFKNFRTVWYNIKECRTMETLLAKLQLEEDQCNRTHETTDEAAFGAKHSNSKKKKKLSIAERKKSSTCRACGEIGHWESDCVNKQNVAGRSGKTNKGDKSKALAFGVIDDVIADDYRNIWIADSGATKHFTSRRDWFTEFQSVTDDRFVETQ